MQCFSQFAIAFPCIILIFYLSNFILQQLVDNLTDKQVQETYLKLISLSRFVYNQSGFYSGPFNPTIVHCLVLKIPFVRKCPLGRRGLVPIAFYLLCNSALQGPKQLPTVNQSNCQLSTKGLKRLKTQMNKRRSQFLNKKLSQKFFRKVKISLDWFWFQISRFFTLKLIFLKKIGSC